MNPVKVITSYVRSSAAELKKVTWPNRESTMRYAMLVIVVSVAIAAFFAALDFGFSRGITYVLSLGQQQSAPVAEEAPVTPDLMPSDIQVIGGDESGSVTVEPEGEEVELQPSFEEVPEGDFNLPPIQ
jgi:preprotein translocase SecE subunit